MLLRKFVSLKQGIFSANEVPDFCIIIMYIIYMDIMYKNLLFYLVDECRAYKQFKVIDLVRGHQLFVLPED